MDVFSLLTMVLIGLAIVVAVRMVPRCPECGSVWGSNLRDIPFRVCDQCQTVWRIR